VIRLRSEAWQLAGAAVAALGVVTMFVAIRRVADSHNVVDVFFTVVGFAIAVAGISLAASSVTLEPGVLVVVNGWRRHRIPVDQVVGIGIAGIGDRRGAGPGEPPPRATWIVRIDTMSGSVLAAGLLANRKAEQREQLLEKAEMVARHCGVGRSPA
jgi:hypothetical protein